MPIYEYQCQACGHHLEALQKISEEPLKDCPKCGQPQLSRLISAAGFRLKGGGWYETTSSRASAATWPVMAEAVTAPAPAPSRTSSTAKPTSTTD